MGLINSTTWLHLIDSFYETDLSITALE